MPFFTTASAICLIACHGGPADHFATYAEELVEQHHTVKIYASGPALKKFEERGIQGIIRFSLEDLQPGEEDLLADQIAKDCSHSLLVLTDVGHAFDIKIQKALAVHAENTTRFAYYDNPEPYVPGGYSCTAASVMRAADGILFANASLAQETIYSEAEKEIDFEGRKRIGIGYYPVDQAKTIAARRDLEHESVRAAFLEKHQIDDRGQKAFVYFGGNNEEYFSKAFPAFLSFLAEASRSTDLGDTLIVLQQHPGAKAKNLDGQQLAAWSKEFGGNAQAPGMLLSDFSSDVAQILADAALYYQTSMGPHFVLAGIPTIQVGHETYEDILIRNNLAPTVTRADALADVLINLEERAKKEPKTDLIYRSLGIREDWPAVLKKTIEECASAKEFVGLRHSPFCHRRRGSTIGYRGFLRHPGLTS